MEKRSIDSDMPADYFRLGKCMLRLGGLWPLENTSNKIRLLHKVYGSLMIFITFLPYNICSIMDTIIHLHFGSWLEIMPRLAVALAMVLGCYKIAVCMYHGPTIAEFMSTYEKPEFCYTPTSFFRPNAHVRRSIWLYQMQVSVCVGLVGILITTDVDAYLKDPFIIKNDSMPALPFVNWLPYDYKTSPQYEVSFGIMNFWFFFCAVTIVVFDTICMGLLIHTAGQLKILKEALTTIWERYLIQTNKAKDYNPYKGAGPETCDGLKKMIKKCAEHHQGIIKFVVDYKKVFSTMILLQFLISCLMICFTILIVTNNSSPMSSRVTSLVILMCSMWELFVYCYFGNEIIVESTMLSRAIFKSKWYLMDFECKKCLMIMMIRCNSPIIVTAGRFTPLSLETFVKILKASYSYYTFLSSLSND